MPNRDKAAPRLIQPAEIKQMIDDAKVSPLNLALAVGAGDEKTVRRWYRAEKPVRPYAPQEALLAALNARRLAIGNEAWARDLEGMVKRYHGDPDEIFGMMARWFVENWERVTVETRVENRANASDAARAVAVGIGTVLGGLVLGGLAGLGFDWSKAQFKRHFKRPDEAEKAAALITDAIARGNEDPAAQFKGTPLP